MYLSNQFVCLQSAIMNQDSFVTKVTGQRLDIWGLILGRGNVFLFTAMSGAHPLCYPVGIRHSFHGSKAAGE